MRYSVAGYLKKWDRAEASWEPRGIAGLHEKWYYATKEGSTRKWYCTYVEKDGGRDEICDGLAETIRPHYGRLARIAEDVERLGHKVAAAILSEAIPRTAEGRSGDLG